ncbi:hypothetical protein OH76DRAFT_1394912 [Lentinus brumalis]|uniref:Uncharacterized protein n=1 Tax=Lentinus brumalis TaxID=2498619 RepID=A0A371DX95_9APHY|nr:hypothetical protein OH76DRAFT_1394912 [Polyporus brumalis]
MSTTVSEPRTKVKYPRVYAPTPESRPVALRTLFEGWLKAEDYVDLSDGRGIIVDPSSGVPTGQSYNATYITYGRADLKMPGHLLIKYFPFPVNTRGHLYYYRHPRIPIAGGLRFRLTQTPEPSKKAFASAPDLLTEYGTPWEISLLALASSPRFNSLLDVLRKDGFLPDGLPERCREMYASTREFFRIGPFSQLVYETMQPFYLNLARPFSGVTLVGEKELIPLALGTSMFPMMRPSENPFKSGIILCRFENVGPPCAFLRVLRVIEPVHMADGYDGPIGKPTVSDIVRFKGKPMLFLQAREGQTATYERWVHREPKSKFAWLWNWELHRKRAREQGTFFPWDREAVPPLSATQ